MLSHSAAPIESTLSQQNCLQMWSNVVSASRYAAMPFEVMTRLTARLISTPIPMKAPPALRPVCVNCQQAHCSLSGNDVDGNIGVDLPSTTHSGYLSIDRGGAALFYVYYAARDVPPENAPVLLWLQVTTTTRSSAGARLFYSGCGTLGFCVNGISLLFFCVAGNGLSTWIVMAWTCWTLGLRAI